MKSIGLLYRETDSPSENAGAILMIHDHRCYWVLAVLRGEDAGFRRRTDTLIR